MLGGGRLQGFVDDGLQLLFSVLAEERCDGGRHTFAEQQRSRDPEIPEHGVGEDPEAFGEFAEVTGSAQGQREQLAQGRPFTVPGAIGPLVVESCRGEVQLRLREQEPAMLRCG